MAIDDIRAKLVYVLRLPEAGTDVSTIDFLLCSPDDEWITLSCETHGASESSVTSYKLQRNAPYLRNLRVNEYTVLAIYAMDHWFIIAGGIWQVYWSQTKDGYELYPICASGIELVEVEALPFSQEHENRPSID